MKITIAKSFCFALPLCAWICGCPDDSYPDSTFIEVESMDRIFVDDDRQSYAINDTLWINSVVPRVIVDNTVGKQYDIFELTGAESARISFKLEKQGAFDNPLVVRFSEDELVLKEGMLEISEYDDTQLICDLLLKDTNYRLRFGIVLKERGDYTISEYYGYPFNITFLDTDYGKDELQNVSLFADFRGADGFSFAFTVE